MNLLSGIESFANNVTQFFNPTTTGIAPISIVSTYPLSMPLVTTYDKSQSAGTGALSTKTQTPASNPFGTLIEWAGKIFNPVATTANTINPQSTPRTATTPVKNATIDLASIFNLAKDAINLGNNIFGNPQSAATPASSTTAPLSLPLKSPELVYYPNNTQPPTQSGITSLFSSTKTETVNTSTNGANNNLWWIIIILAILMIVSMTRKG